MMMPDSSAELSLGAFVPAEGSKPIQTPYGSLQLAGNAFQQQFGGAGMTGLGGTLVPEESEEDDEEDDDEEDENGNKKRKRKQLAAAKKASAGATQAGGQAAQQAVAAGAQNARSGAGAGTGSGASQTAQASSNERDAHTGRRKIRIEFIEDDSRRHITFSKRKAGIMKKAYELATLTGTQVLLLIVSQTGLVYTFTTPKLSPVVQQAAGRELIQSCLNAPDPNDVGADDDGGLRSNSSDQQQASASAVMSSGNNAHSSNSNPLNVPSHLMAGMHANSNNSSSNGNNNPSVYSSAAMAGFHDPRQQAALMGLGSMPGMSMSLPAHMHGIGAAYGYSNPQQLVGGGHDGGIPYGSYGI